MVIINEILEEKEEAVSSSTISDHKYQVFLSFRGEDTRLGFTDHLYKALVEANIDTFRDNRIQTGDDLNPELEKAIKQSRASIIVLSKNYAFSTWCLNELVLILEQRRKSGMIVLPIFYHVDPSHVRKQEDSFAEGLKKHERGIQAETDLEKKQQKIYKLKLWKEALTQVAGMKGKDIKDRYETEFIKEIVNEIDSRVESKVSSTFQHFVGMFCQVQKIESWLQDGSVKDVDIITICGMGGIGKTTLAKYIYNKNFSLFENSCFLENIGKKSTSLIPDGKLSLQIQLLKDIKGKQDISRVDEGTSMIEKALKRKRVLLVLDDVDNVDQLDVLLGTKGLYPGSKIIITTKDRLLPKKCEVWNAKFLSKKYTEHLLKGLGMNESLELLSWHAFKCKSPKEGYEEPSRKAVEYCQGHPLALKVLGSSLFQKDVAAWEESLESLGKEPNLDIHNVLKLSFDSLSENDKKLFKYIACCFVGKDTDYIGKILNECGIGTSSGIPNLVDKCLLTVSVNYVDMHQLLQDMGRHIVHQESPEIPWNRTILCCHNEAFNVLKEDEGTSKTKALLMDNKFHFEDEHHKNLGTLALLGWLVLLCSKFHPEEEEDDEDEGNLKTESFTKMKNLELLQLKFIHLTGSYKKFPKRLRWLCWHGFPSQYIPPEFPMTKLVVLDMSHSNLEGLWKVPKLLNSLKIFDLSNSLKLVRTGDFSGVPNLERLILAACVNLVEISESIGELHGLALLDLSYCVNLRNFPRKIRKLSEIKTLRLDGCCHLFKTLVVPRSPQSPLLLPQSIVKLNLSRNNLYNESFPVDFSSLSSLTDLNLGSNPMDSLPDCVRSLSRIEYLDIRLCENLKSALDLPSSIDYLRADNSRSLEIITFHSFSSIEIRIDTSSCPKLREVQFFYEVEKVENDCLSCRWHGWPCMCFLEVQQEVIMYKGRILTTYIPDNKVPNWFSDKTSISFTVHPSPNNKRIRGLKVGFLKKDSPGWVPISTTVIVNMTNNLILICPHKVSFGSRDGDEVVMSNWILDNNELNVGDQVYIYHFSHREECWNDNDCCDPLRRIIENNKEFDMSDEEYVRHCKNVKGCGFDIVYDDNELLQDTGTRTLDYHNLWEDRVGCDFFYVDQCDLLQISIHGN